MDPREIVNVAKDALDRPPPKPGYRATEFYVSLVAMAVGAFLASGVLPETHWAVKAAGVAAVVLTALGYQVQRTKAKSG